MSTKGYAACAIVVLLASIILPSVHAYEVSDHLSVGEIDYWWISNVQKDDIVLITIIGGYQSWQSKLYYSNLTVIKTISQGGTHIYEFYANATDDYLLRLYSGLYFSFDYTIQSSHQILEQSLHTVHEHLSVGEVNYWWISNVSENDLVLLTIKGGAQSWQSRLYYSNLTVIETISKGGTHAYEFYAEETDDYLLRLYSGLYFSFSYTVQCTHLVLGHDVAITEVSAYKTMIGQGFPLKIYVNASNIGNFNEAIDVTTFYNSTPMDTMAVENLMPDEIRTLLFIWNTTSVTKGNYTISAECSMVPYEIDTRDNALTDGWVVVTVAGDMDGDYDVDFDDIVAIAMAYGSTRGDLNWNPNADIDGDDDVDFDDVVTAAMNYGREM